MVSMILLGTRSRQNHQPSVGGVTWNPTDKNANIVLSGSNLVATQGASSQWDMVRATLSHSSAKWYFELLLSTAPTYSIVGIAGASANLASYVGADTAGWGYYNNNGTTVHNSSQVRYGATYTNGDVIGIAVDLSAGNIWFAKNGVWQNSGDPVAETAPAWTGITGAVFPAVSPYDAGTIWHGRFSNAQFSYTPPTGFTSWSGT